MSSDILEDIRDCSQSHLRINIIEAQYKIRDRIKEGQVEWKGALLSIKNTIKGLHKVFRDVVNQISQALPILGEFGSAVF